MLNPASLISGQLLLAVILTSEFSKLKSVFFMVTLDLLCILPSPAGFLLRAKVYKNCS